MGKGVVLIIVVFIIVFIVVVVIVFIVFVFFRFRWNPAGGRAPHRYGSIQVTRQVDPKYSGQVTNS